MGEKLFDSAFLKRLEYLRFIAKRVPPAGRHADHPSLSKGGGVEFSDFKPYMQGEDLKNIDWNVYLRLRKLFLKQFTEERDVPIHILFDVSKSMFFEKEREIAAKKTVAGFAWIGLSGHDKVFIHTFSDEPLQLYGPCSNKNTGYAMLKWLENINPQKGTNILKAVNKIKALKGRRGIMVLISDFFQKGGLEPIFHSLSGVRHSIIIVQLYHPEDRSPKFTGEVRLIDCETKDCIDCTVNSQLIESYRNAYKRFEKSIYDFCVRSRSLLFQMDVTKDIINQIESLFLGGRLKV